MSDLLPKNGVTRRDFIASAGLAAAGFTIVPSHVMAGFGHKAPSDKLNIAVVGIGGMGNSNLKAVKATENIVALCDVDWKYAAKVFKENPQAKQYKDWRKMFDEMGKEIDAVIVATADHTHAVITAAAITMGKHVYVQKPLTHSVYESRLLTNLASHYKIASQMGNQGSSGEGIRTTCAWLWNNEIGEVTKVEAFTDRPIWPQGLNRPDRGDWVPETLDWDLFIGPAQMRPYNQMYTPWNWRGWWDFGTGALGDMACHILHPVFKGLKLNYPSKAQGSSTLLLSDCAPTAQTVMLTFPERKTDRATKFKLPQVEVTWYDGGIQPMKPEGWPAGKDMNNNGGGVIFHGTKDKLICGCYGRDPWLLSGRVPTVEPTSRQITVSHEMDWVRACKETPENRVETASPFREAGPFNEMVVMGVLAVKLQSLNKELLWDGENMRFTNITDAEQIKVCTLDKFSITDGDPKFTREYTKPVPAVQYANELIKHTYRAPWTLPDMPKV